MTQKEIKHESYKILLNIFNKDIKKVQEKIEKNSKSREAHKLSINVKGYEVSKESDLDDLIAGDVINSTQYLRYQKKLRDVQQSVKYDNNEEVLNFVIKCLGNVKSSCEQDIYLIEHPEEDWKHR